MKNINNTIEKYCEFFGFSPFAIYKDKLLDCRGKSRIPENTKTVITLLFPYYLGEEAYENLNVSRYAAVSDYHTVAGKYLGIICEELKKEYPENEFVYFADNSPIPEVFAAVKSGLGVKGRNGLFINEKYGSWVFIGEIITDLFVPCEEKEITFCVDCRKCLDACPTGVLKDEVFDKEKCLSHISQKKGEIPEEYKEMMKRLNCAWGCDECQKACPYNINAEKTTIREFIESFNPVVTGDTSIEGRAFEWRGDKVIRRNIEVLEEKL
ncbi:MAG: DUF1730 domain-containing protein [Clostridia bacterium]|nr:DUF1730 domain-containing protein [Clostridia bacterium]